MISIRVQWAVAGSNPDEKQRYNFLTDYRLHRFSNCISG